MVEVAIEVGAGQHHGERRRRPGRAPALRSLRPSGARAGRSAGRRRRPRRSPGPRMSTSATGARKRCQRAAVCQLPLLAAAARRRDDAGPAAAGRGRCSHRSMMACARRRSPWPLTRAASPATTLAAALRDSRATTLRLRPSTATDWTRAAAGRPQPDRLGARPPRLVRRVLDPARPARARRRRASCDAARPPRIAGPDAIFDSARLAHADRWTAPLPGRAELAATPRRAARRLPRRDRRATPTTTPRTTSIASRCSTRTCTARRSPGRARRWPGRRPRAWRRMPRPARRRAAADRRRRARPRPRAGRARLLVRQRAARPPRVRLAPFEIDAAPVTQRRVPALRRSRRLRRTPRFWPGAAGAWRAAAGRRPSAALAPRRRRPLAGALVRPLAAARPRRAGDPRQRLGGRGLLPLGRSAACRARPSGNARPATRASAGAAASGNGPPTPSSPYPGFVAGPYADYSRALVRRSSRAARRRVRHARRGCIIRAIAISSRPERSDVFAGFRTAALLHPDTGTHAMSILPHSPRPPRRSPLSLAGLPSACAQQPGVLRVSAIPDEAPTELQRKFKPLGDYLKKETGLDVQFTPVTDYAAVVEGLATNKIDLAWLGGFTFVQAKLRTNGGAVPIVQRAEDEKFTSRFIVPDREHREDAGRPEGQDLRLRLAVVDLGQPDAALLPAAGRHRARAATSSGRVLRRARRHRRLRRRRPGRGRRAQRLGAGQADRSQEPERRQGARAGDDAALLRLQLDRAPRPRCRR